MSWLPTATNTSASSGTANSLWKRATYSTNSSGWHHLPSSNKSPVPGGSTSSLIVKFRYCILSLFYPITYCTPSTTFLTFPHHLAAAHYSLYTGLLWGSLYIPDSPRNMKTSGWCSVKVVWKARCICHSLYINDDSIVTSSSIISIIK